jgi:molybdenum cofactor cytidylyltransferase
MSGGAILLAAGYGRRFGSDKRRHALPDGTPLLISSLRLYARAFPQLIVVLRPEDQALAKAVMADNAAGNVRVVPCPDARYGMGHSLACGVQAATGWSYLFVALADMAWVDPQTLARLNAVLAGAPADAVVQPVHDGTPGHPVGFGAARFPQLLQLTGDEGARTVVRDAGASLIRVPVDDPGVLEDLDREPS